MNVCKIAIIEDEKIHRITLCDDLTDLGFETIGFEKPLEFLEYLKTNKIDIVVSDIKMPQISGIELLIKIKEFYPDIQVIIMTAYATIDSAINAMKNGAYDYLTKPFKIDELVHKIHNISELQRNIKDKKQFISHFENNYSFDKYIGQSIFVKELRKMFEIVCNSNSSVLITGETGTGKELIANIIHYNSLRKNKPLIKVSCAILSRDIFESELFGHVKGAFTGAMKDRVGRFEQADGGTIYLDDIDDIPVDLQVKLLRVLQENEIERLGSNKPVKIDVRIIASTKYELKNFVIEKKFRQDLYYRLNVIPINIPPLRERIDDVQVLVDHFIQELAPGRKFSITTEALNIFKNYKWFGNIRELKNIMERLILLSRNNIIDKNDIPYDFFISDNVEYQINDNIPLNELVEETEIKAIIKALKSADFNKAKAAKLLDIPASTLKSKIEKYAIKFDHLIE